MGQNNFKVAQIMLLLKKKILKVDKHVFWNLLET